MRANGKICLLNPGPVTLSERVRRALLSRDICHREPEFADLQNDVRDRLARVYPDTQTEYTAVLITGSGTAAVEAMLDSLVPREGKALVVANGVYGERMAAILQAHGKRFETVRAEWTEPMNLAETENKLERDRELTHLIAVHHETTTGRLNDIAALGALCNKHGVALLLDAVSSFGGEQIDFRKWNVEGCAATSNKCLHGVPGISFVLARRSAIESRSSAATTLYLDLFRNYREQSKGYPLFTPAIQVMYALQEALVEMEEAGGWRRRQQSYQALSRILRVGLGRQGLRLLLGDERHYSNTLSSFLLPEGVKFEYLYTQLKEAGFVIYPGQNSLFETIFRVAVMGDLSPADMEDFVNSFAGAVERFNRIAAISGAAAPAPLG